MVSMSNMYVINTNTCHVYIGDNHTSLKGTERGADLMSSCFKLHVVASLGQLAIDKTGAIARMVFSSCLYLLLLMLLTVYNEKELLCFYRKDPAISAFAYMYSTTALIAGTLR